MSKQITPRTRLYVNVPLAGGAEVIISDKQAHYITQVLRQKLGNEICLFNSKDGEWIAEIADAGKKSVTLSIKKQLRPQKSSPDIWLLAAPLKSGKTEFVLEKATELGISCFIPVETQFSVVDRINESRFSAIALEASEQCERLDIPEIKPMISLQELLKNWDGKRKIIFGDESGKSRQAKDLLSTLPQGKYAILIGPEGGFSSAELEILRTQDYVIGMCMGPRIMRADTAAIAALTLVQSAVGDWDDKPEFRNIA